MSTASSATVHTMTISRRPTHRSIAQAFGSVLRRRRLAADLTQAQLAEASQIDVTFPSMLERGLRGPTLLTVLSIAKALHVKPGILVEETEKELSA